MQKKGAGKGAAAVDEFTVKGGGVKPAAATVDNRTATNGAGTAGGAWAFFLCRQKAQPERFREPAAKAPQTSPAAVQVLIQAQHSTVERDDFGSMVIGRPDGYDTIVFAESICFFWEVVGMDRKK